MDEYGINDVLREIRSKSFTEKDKGSTFEMLMKRWFKTDPLYASHLKEVWLWDEFPCKKDFGGRDVGIDLVAKTDSTDSWEYWAIQCKCYAENKAIEKPDIDSFLSTSSKSFYDETGVNVVSFSKRILVSTTNHWGANAEETIQNQNPPVSRITLRDLSISPVNWRELFKGREGKEALAEGKQLREDQSKAISKAEEHYKENDRGKLIMACGTGKTFTSLRLVERLLGERGLVLFMVPSIGLMGQSLNDWAADAQKPLKAICVCSDSKVVKKTRRSSEAEENDSDEPSDSTVDLAFPASTSVGEMIRQLKEYRLYEGLVVVFSTYQSIDVVSAAQKEILKETNGEYGVFDFIVCDEAHRTTGVKLSSQDDSSFTKIHDNDIVQGRKRLYMTATPRLYGENAKIKASKKNCILCSMDDEKLYGKEFYRVNFSQAVQNGILTDYKVLVLTVSEDLIPESVMKDDRGNYVKELNYDDTGKLIGVINGLSKKILGDNGQTWDADPKLMRRALAFTHKIGARGEAGTSKNIEHILPIISEKYCETLTPEEQKKVVHVKVKHVDGTFKAVVRNDAIGWLAKEAEDPQECHVITNVRCLSEGIDVPALDAVLFLSARNSQVDVVQSVGRVMRSFGKGTEKEKKYGYIIIPIVVPENTKPEDALNNNDTFSVVWDILNALRSHDDNFNAYVNTIALNKNNGTKVTIGKPGFGLGTKSPQGDGNDANDAKNLSNLEVSRTLEMRPDSLQEAVLAKLVEKCGDRLYWENWAGEVGMIARKYMERIKRLVTEEDNQYMKEFDEFVKNLRHNLNPSISHEQCIEMLAQHLITKPIFETLFSDYKFIDNNSISNSMQFMNDYLEAEAVNQENDTLNRFFESVRVTVGGANNLRAKQSIIKDLYEKFFKRAFPRTVETLGTIYTPVECVDFIIHSVDAVLKSEFGTALTNENVHILDPFTGTGTFITRLLQSGVIKKEDMLRKYKQEIHCNEIMLLAYYIADVNIEAVFNEEYDNGEYVPFNGICLTDTFQMNEEEEDDMFKKFFKGNSDSVNMQKKTPVRVIIGNPPYSVGQRHADDNAQNQHYEKLEKKIADTYAKSSVAANKNSLYDSYIKAFRWATDRIDSEEGGVVAFISNGAWIDGNAQDGFRATLAKDFDKIYVFNLRGNQRTGGELSRREGGKIFGSGSRTPIAITFLVRYPQERHGKGCDIFYHDIGDYLSREEKLKIIKDSHSIENIEWEVITPNEKQDWINQRGGLFDTLLPLAPDKKFKESHSVFSSCSGGIKTNKDVFLYNSSREALTNTVQEMIDYYNTERERIQSSEKKDLIPNPNKIVWTETFRKAAINNVPFKFDGSKITDSIYRPFFKQRLCYQKELIERTYRQTTHVPTPEKENLQICVSGVGVTKDFTCMITDKMPDLEFVGKSQCFPLYWYEENKHKKQTLFPDIEDDYVRRDGISDWILKEVRNRFSGAQSLKKEDIFYYVYGLLHSPDYRSLFATDLKKALPRIPIVEDVTEFMAFSEAGKKLAELHLNYEKVRAHPEVEVVGLDMAPSDGQEAYDYFRIIKNMQFKSKNDKTTIVYNGNITITNIPQKAYEYVVNGRTAIEWLIDRYQVSQDRKSRKRNDCNDWAREHNNPRYILDLVLSVINVSTKTVDIVNSLPRLRFE